MNFRLQISGPDFQQDMLIPPSGLTIGRQEDNALVLKNPRVSRQHARLLWMGDQLQIVDLGSANGTHLNQEALTANWPVDFSTGDVLNIGPYTLTLLAQTFESQPALMGYPKPVPADRIGFVSMQAEEGSSQPASPISPPPFGGFPVGVEAQEPRDEFSQWLLPGKNQYLLQYLPEPYHTDFMERFLAIFESILVPIEWNIDNFDLYLDPGTTPTHFLNWLVGWFEPTRNFLQNAQQARLFLKDAYMIYARRGTRWALSKILEIVMGQTPEIVDTGSGIQPFSFEVRLPIRAGEVDRARIEDLIDANKPAHTSYQLVFKE